MVVTPVQFKKGTAVVSGARRQSATTIATEDLAAFEAPCNQVVQGSGVIEARATRHGKRRISVIRTVQSRRYFSKSFKLLLRLLMAEEYTHVLSVAGHPALARSGWLSTPATPAGHGLRTAPDATPWSTSRTSHPRRLVRPPKCFRGAEASAKPTLEKALQLATTDVCRILHLTPHTCPPRRGEVPKRLHERNHTLIS
jgi:hypothetical protein